MAVRQSSQGWRGVGAVLVLAGLVGCGGATDDPSAPPEVTVEVVDGTTRGAVQVVVFNAVAPFVIDEMFGEYSELDVAIDLDCVAAGVSFGAAAQAVEFGWGSRLVRVLSAEGVDPCTGEVLLTEEHVDLGSDAVTTVAVYTTGDGELAVAAFPLAYEEQTRLSVRQTSTAEAVAVVAASEEAEAEVGPLAPGEESSVELEPGTYVLTVSEADGGETLLERTVEVPANSTLAVHLVGGGDSSQYDAIAFQL